MPAAGRGQSREQCGTLAVEVEFSGLDKPTVFASISPSLWAIFPKARGSASFRDNRSLADVHRLSGEIAPKNRMRILLRKRASSSPNSTDQLLSIWPRRAAAFKSVLEN